MSNDFDILEYLSKKMRTFIDTNSKHSKLVTDPPWDIDKKNFNKIR